MTTVIEVVHRVEDGMPVTYQLRQVSAKGAYWYCVYRNDDGKVVNRYIGKRLPAAQEGEQPDKSKCKGCGADLPAQVKGKRKKFCGDGCRVKWHRQQKTQAD